MDRNELNLKIEELKTAMNNRDFDKAVDIAEVLELRKIKDNNILSLVADAYELTHNYKEAKKVLLMAYENTNAGRHLAYRLCLIAVKNKEYDEAMEYYEDFLEMAPRDSARYILKYKMSKAQGESIEKLIEILEEYVNIDMEEKWAYELAKLYHMAGDEEKCVDMCDEISLWFAEGKYVIKAMDLKKMYRPLTAVQQKKYEESKRKNTEEAAKAEAEKIEKKEKPFEINGDEDMDVPEIKIKPIGEDKFNTMDIQEVIADGMREVEIKEEANIHEEVGATKVAPNLKGSGEVEEVVSPVLDETIEQEEIEELDELEELEEFDGLEAADEPDAEKSIEIEPIKDIKGVEDVLKQLQERGILKAETVRQAVNIIDEAGKERKTEPNNKPEDISTIERWAEDDEPVKAENDEPVKTENSESVKAEDNEPVKAETDEPVKSEDNNSVNTGEQPSIKNDVPKIVEDAVEEPIQIEEPSGVPVFDLSFESPIRDSSNDIGQKNMYENIVANSDLGNSTDKLPSKEEIEEAIKTAEQAVENEKEETSLNENPATDNAGEASGLHSSKELSAKVEIISGTDWKQPEVETSEEPTAKSEEMPSNTTGEELITKSKEQSENVTAEEHIETKMTLSEEELSAFKNYLNVEGFESNIREVLQKLIENYNPNGKSEIGNVIIMGAGQTGKTTLAIEIIRLVNRKRGRRNRKLAKVDASVLNRRGFRKSLNKLLGSDLVVENAQNLGAMTLSEIIDATGMFTDDMLIILEGDTQGMEKVLNASPRVNNVFNHVIRIKEYDIKEWVEYGIRYANEQGYNVDELARLAFYKAIDDFFGVNKGIGQSDVEDMVDQAISKSNRIGRKLSGIFSSKKDEEGLNILVESDFNV